MRVDKQNRQHASNEAVGRLSVTTVLERVLPEALLRTELLKRLAAACDYLPK